MSLIRVFQIALKGGAEKIPPSGEGMGNFTRGGFFYQVVSILGRLHLIIQACFKVKKHHSVNIEHQLKSKLA